MNRNPVKVVGGSQTLRQAAALMRERAENSATATVGPLTWTSTFTADTKDSQTCRHYQSWHPVVAIAVADWLDSEARVCERADANYPDRAPQPADEHALAVAYLYLGGDA